jgi:hypothetical protein
MGLKKDTDKINKITMLLLLDIKICLVETNYLTFDMF